MMVSSLRFGTRLTSQSGGEDDAVGGRSRIGALRMKNWYAVFEDDAEGGRSWVGKLRLHEQSGDVIEKCKGELRE